MKLNFGMVLGALLMTGSCAQAQKKNDLEALWALSVASQNARARTEPPPDKRAIDVGFDAGIIEEEMKVIEESLGALVENGSFIERYVVVPFPKDMREWSDARKKEFENLLNGLRSLSGRIGLKYGFYSAEEMCDLSRVRIFGHFIPEGGCPFKVRAPKQFEPQVDELLKKFGYQKAPQSRGMVEIEVDGSSRENE